MNDKEKKDYESFRQYERKCRLEDLLGKLEQFDEDEAGVLAGLGEDEQKEVLIRNNTVDRLDKALSNNDAYWDAYWTTVQYVLEEIRDDEEKKEGRCNES